MSINVSYPSGSAVRPKSIPRRKKADQGLSPKERIFVHALRALFDPHGKSKEVSGDSPKGYVSRSDKPHRENPPKGGEPAKKSVKKSESRATTGAIPRLTRTDKRGAKLSKDGREKAKAARSEGAAEKKHLSPSKVKRAEKRKVAHSKIKEVSGETLSVPVAGSARNRLLLWSLNRFKQLTPEVYNKNSVGSARLGESLKAGVVELEVVRAFGIGCLQELMKFQASTTVKNFPSFIPEFSRSTVKDKIVWSSSGVYMKVKRDYTKAVKGLGIKTEKSRPDATSFRLLPNKVGLAVVPAKVPKVKKALEKKTPTKKSPSQIRRKERRRLAVAALSEPKGKGKVAETVKGEPSVETALPRTDFNAELALVNKERFFHSRSVDRAKASVQQLGEDEVTRLIDVFSKLGGLKCLPDRTKSETMEVYGWLNDRLSDIQEEDMSDY
jgi:hypothetical protein